MYFLSTRLIVYTAMNLLPVPRLCDQLSGK